MDGPQTIERMVVGSNGCALLRSFCCFTFFFVPRQSYQAHERMCNICLIWAVAILSRTSYCAETERFLPPPLLMAHNTPYRPFTRLGRFSTAAGMSMIIVANGEWSDLHANASRLCSSVGWHRNESLCTLSKEKTRRALKVLRFFRYFSTTRTYLDDNRERERGAIVSVGVDPTGTFWSRLATFHVYDQITIATRRQTSICPRIMAYYRRFTRRADQRLMPGCYGNLIVNVKCGQSQPNVPVGSTPTDMIGPRSRS